MVFAVKLASRLHMSVDEVLKLPLAKAMAFDTALRVIDGKQPATANISNKDKEIVKFLSDNQKDALEKLKSMRRF
jgi:hypothetical protein